MSEEDETKPDLPDPGYSAISVFREVYRAHCVAPQMFSEEELWFKFTKMTRDALVEHPDGREVRGALAERHYRQMCHGFVMSHNALYYVHLANKLHTDGHELLRGSVSMAAMEIVRNGTLPPSCFVDTTTGHIVALTKDMALTNERMSHVSVHRAVLSQFVTLGPELAEELRTTYEKE